MKKKILIFSLNFYPKYIGGAEVAIKEIVERQNRNLYEFYMITLRFDSSLPRYEFVQGIHVYRIGFAKRNASIADLKFTYLKYNKYLYQVYAGFYALYLNRKYKFNAIWAMMAHSCGVPAGIFKYFKSDVKYILTLQEGDPPEHIEKLAKPFFPPLSTISYALFQNGFKRADILQTISTFLMSWGRRMEFKGYGTVIPNAVDTKKFSREYNYLEIKDVQDALGKRPGEVWLITTSRLVLKNGVDDVITAIASLPSEIHFAILGIGPDEAKLIQLASKLKISHRIHFIGEVKHENIPKYLKACDIFIRPSRSEGMGNSFVEAMAARLPVIATTEGGLSDFIFDLKTAYECKKDNPESIVLAVKRVLSDEERKQRILDTAFQMVAEKYDWNLIAMRMQNEVFAKI